MRNKPSFLIGIAFGLALVKSLKLSSLEILMFYTATTFSKDAKAGNIWAVLLPVDGHANHRPPVTHVDRAPPVGLVNLQVQIEVLV